MYQRVRGIKFDILVFVKVTFALLSAVTNACVRVAAESSVIETEERRRKPALLNIHKVALNVDGRFTLQVPHSESVQQ